MPEDNASAVVIDAPLTWREVAAVAEGRALRLSSAAVERLVHGRQIVEAVVERGIRAYGVSTGVGALCEVLIDREDQRRLSRNLLMSHACGVGAPLPPAESRAVLCAAVNNWCHGHSGVRRGLVEMVLALLEAGCVPEMPSRGSLGYLTHMAHAALVLIGEGRAVCGGRRVSGAEALRLVGLKPLVLEAKEGLSLINGTPCATGLAALALARVERLARWADRTAAMTFENLRGQLAAFDEQALALRPSPGLLAVGRDLRRLLAGSGILATHAGARTVDPLSLRAVPHVHGAVRDQAAFVAEVVDRELAAVTDNPIVAGTPEAPLVHSQAHAVGEAVALAMDALATAVAALGAMAERRIDRLINPLVSRLPPFLTAESGLCSGFMIPQYTAASLVAENRRLAQPASVEGGITSALHEDHLTHATPAAAKALAVIENVEAILAIELLAACQAYDLQASDAGRAAGTNSIYCAVRSAIPPYGDDRPFAEDMARAVELIRSMPSEAIDP